MSEEKLQEAIERMREALGSESFWEARKSCMELFAEATHPALRADYWQQFRQLSDQARAL